MDRKAQDGEREKCTLILPVKLKLCVSLLLVRTPGSFRVKSETGLCTLRARRDQRKRQATPDGWVAGLIRTLPYKVCPVQPQDE